MTVQAQMAAKGNVNLYTGGELEVWYLAGAPVADWVARIEGWVNGPQNAAILEIVSTLVAALVELPLDHDAHVIAPDPIYFT